jgi:transcriptional regulator GlxA family with amidase domain
MKENLSRKLTEKELAHQAGLTAQHFCVLFKGETGETPARHLNRLRMEKARELLEDDQSRLSIKEIATVVGWSDLSHFVRDFEKRFGLSPKRYRASRGGKN